METIKLQSVIGDNRLDYLISLISRIKNKEVDQVNLDWSRVQQILPAGQAILACLFDVAVEQGCRLDQSNVNKKNRGLPVVQNLMSLEKYLQLPKPIIHDFAGDGVVIVGSESSLNLSFIEKMRLQCGTESDEDLDFACQLLVNELMQNCVDHSTSERYYLYAGRVSGEIHLGVLDLGITIPAKLEQKYVCANDIEFLALSFKEGISTRRQRTGGLGLNHTFDLIKRRQGTLVVVSRAAQIRYYFGSKSIHRRHLPQPLNGTWCFARFPVKEEI